MAGRMGAVGAKPAAAGGGPAVYFSDSFGGTGTLDGTTTEVGSKTWEEAGGSWTRNGSGDVRDLSTATHANASADSGQNDFSLRGDMTFGKGSATGHWSGICFLSSDGATVNGLSLRPDGTSGAPTLKLFQGTSTILENWDISAVNISSTGSRLTENDRATIRIDYNATTYTISAYLDDQLVGTHTLSGGTGPATGNKATYGSNTWHGLYSNERLNPGDTLWHSVICQERTP